MPARVSPTGVTEFTDRERREFVRNGFLVRDDVVDDDLIAAGREAIAEGLDVDPDDPAEYVGTGYTENAAGDADSEPFEAIVDQLFPAVETLVGEGVLAEPSGGMQLAINFPEADATDDFPMPRRATGHLDGYKNFDSNPEVGGGTVAACVYVDDVAPRSGGFTVWPESHRVAAKYFEDHCLETVGGKPNNSQVPAVGEESGEWDYGDLLWNRYDPYEIAGAAGTVILWHYRLTHTAGIHVGEDVRMSAIKRFSREDEAEIMRDAARKPFEYWPAMEGVEHLPSATLE
jgi:hypothetical protein